MDVPVPIVARCSCFRSTESTLGKAHCWLVADVCSKSQGLGKPDVHKADAQELPSGPDFSHEVQKRRYSTRVCM